MTQLSPTRRPADIARLNSEQFDMLVVGGGVVGAGTALDAATRGLSVALVEAQDWAAGTSSRSSKLVHGGLRYLQMLDFTLVREALRERGVLLRLAPHLVKPLPILYPLRRPLVERVYVGAGIALYDTLAWTSRASRGVPLHRHLSRKAVLAVAPGLKAGSLVGAVRYYDAQVDDARYVVEVVRTAAGLGAVAVNRMAVDGFLRHGDRVAGARLRDAETGARYEVRARATVLATGPWTEVTEALAGRERVTLVRPSKGVHFMVPRQAIDSSVALILRTERSVLFVLPWGRHWMIGTTDTDWPYDIARPLAGADDIDYLLEEVNTILARPLSRADIEGVFAGLRPLVAGVGVVRGPGEGRGPRKANGPAEETTKLSREHAIGRPTPGLVVVSGGKYTTYRVMAADAVDAAVADGGFSQAGPSLTGETPLIGAAGYKPMWAARHRLASDHGLEVADLEHLLARFGGRTHELLEAIAADPALARPLEGAPGYLRAEVVHAVTHEGARHLEDILLRRLRVGIEAPDGGAAAAPEAAALIAGLLGWDETVAGAEVEDYVRQAQMVKEASVTIGDDNVARLGDKYASWLPLP